MAERLQSLKHAPDPKLQTLKTVLAETPSRKVAIFTAFQDTAIYLRDRFQRQPDLLAGRKWTVVIGVPGRPERSHPRTRTLLSRISVTDNPDFKPDDGEVDVLLSTDILSEGQNLQQAQAVLSFDMPWNPQRVVQRNGRVIRLRSPHDTAYLYTLLPKRGDLDRLLKLESKLQAKILGGQRLRWHGNARLGRCRVRVPGLCGSTTPLCNRLADGDATLLELNEQDRRRSPVQRSPVNSSALISVALPKKAKLFGFRSLPWGIGAAFVRQSPALAEPAVFFACRTRRDERYWRMISESGDILHREDLPMLRLIDPGDQLGCPVPEELDLERLFSLAAADICETHNALLDPEKRADALPASQRWALDVLRSPDAPPDKNSTKPTRPYP